MLPQNHQRSINRSNQKNLLHGHRFFVNNSAMFAVSLFLLVVVAGVITAHAVTKTY
jgi:hypothetical protein